MKKTASSSATPGIFESAGYGAGAFGINLINQSITLYLLYFYTDVYGISAAAIGILFSISRCVDFAGDVVIGYLVDHTHTRWGRFRPYLLFGALPLGIIAVFCFSTPRFGSFGKIVYACITQLFLFLSMTFCGMHIKNGAVIYFLKYNLADEDLISLYFTVTLPAGFIGVAVAPALSRRIGKREAMISGCGMCAGINFLLFFVPYHELLLIFILSALNCILAGLISVLAFSMVADTVEYGEWKTGKRTEGIIYAFFTFCLKLSIAAAGALSALVLSVSGYQPNVAQNAAAGLGIDIIFSLLVSGVSVLAIIAVWFYGMDDAMYGTILRQVGNGRRDPAS